MVLGWPGVHVLAVSDIHNNPAALRFVLGAARAFAVACIVDAGDLADWGRPLNPDLISALDTCAVPYFLTPGNHDSPQTLATVAGRGPVTVVNGPVQLGGLSLLGVADPGAHDPAPALELALLDQQQAVVEWQLGLRPTPPELLVIHNPRVAAAFAGRVPVIVTGHTHVPTISFRRGTLIVNPGTAGARALPGLTAPVHSLSVITLGGTPLRPLTADTVQVAPTQGAFTATRSWVRSEDKPPAGPNFPPGSERDADPPYHHRINGPCGPGAVGAFWAGRLGRRLAGPSGHRTRSGG